MKRFVLICWTMISFLGGGLLAACNLGLNSGAAANPESAANQALVQGAEVIPPDTQNAVTPFPTRPSFAPGEMVEYVAQTGDTLPALAARFNTSIPEILAANTFIPATATTMPPGMPMKIPIYYLPFWGSPYRIIPDSLFINGPAQIGFSTAEFIEAYPGWLKTYRTYVNGQTMSGAAIIDYIALHYSISPRLLMALIEFQAGGLTQPAVAPELVDYPLGYQSWDHKGLYRQLDWVANLLNDGYYRHRMGALRSIVRQDGRIERPDPWLNAASASLHNYFITLYPLSEYEIAISADGFAKTYQGLFGDIWQNEQPHIPGSLVQPEFTLPFEPGEFWAYTGGPHTGWGKDQPYAAIDFAPPSVAGGCLTTFLWATAVASGVVVRSSDGELALDMDGDGDERTGWIIYYLHIAAYGRAPLGAKVEQGESIGHPSCEGGTSTGTHIHIARKYNGEWILADGILAFNLEGWIAHNGAEAYLGTLTKNTATVIACQCSNRESFIEALSR